MIHHAQAQSGQAIGEGSCFPFAGDQYGLVDGIGYGQCNVGVASFESIGGAEQIDFAIFQRSDRGPSGIETLNRDGQTGYFFQETGVIGGKTFIVLTTGGQVEWGIVRGRRTERQLVFLFDPLSLGFIQPNLQRSDLRAAEQRVVFIARCPEQRGAHA
ncbi:hypothetical protein D3C81_1732190 [compost metagenome]